MAEQVELELKIKGGNKAVKTLGQLEQELDKAREAIKGVEVGSKAFDELATQIQKASSEVKTLEKKMEGLEPHQRAEAFLKLGEGIAGGFAVAQGAMGLLGVESEDLEKIQVKVQSAIAIAQGVRMMSEAALMATTAKRVIVEKFAIVQTKIGIVTAKAQAVANYIWTGSQTATTVAVSATTVALGVLRAAIIATGVGALVVGVVALVSAMGSWLGSSNKLTEAENKLAEAQSKKNREISKTIQHKRELANAESEEAKKILEHQKSYANWEKMIEDSTAKMEKNREIINSGVSDRLTKELEAENTKRQAGIENAKTRLEYYDAEIDKLDKLIKTNQKKVDDDKAAADAEQKRLDDAEAAADARRQKRRDKRKKDAEDLLSLDKELALMRIEDDNERAAAKIEQDRQRDLEAAVGQKEQILLINEKYDMLEAERKQKVDDDFWEKKIADNDKYNEELAQKTQERIDKETEAKEKAAAKQLELDQLVEDTKANMISQGFELAKTLGGKNKKIQKGIAVSETIFHTQKSIMRALADIPAPWGVAQAALHGAMGAAAIGTILSESTEEVTADTASTPDPMIPSASGAFTLGGGGIEQQAMRAYVVTDEMSDSQAQLADIRRRSTI